MEDVGFDAVFASTAWWDGHASWFIAEHNALARLAPKIIGVVEAPFEGRRAAKVASTDPDALRIAYRQALRIARRQAKLVRADGLRIRGAPVHGPARRNRR